MLFNDWTWKAGALLVDDMWGMWDGYPDERDVALDTLLSWKHRSLGRELLVLSGDLHTGVNTEIYKDGKPAFWQMVTSSIGNTEYGWMLLNLGKRVINSMEDRNDHKWSFHH